jgi:peptidoglycan/LPS O-acetylase OafA/YrhL
VEYRKEIDGLRAVAVIPVILFHAGFPQFSGGFVGVDVFFVISGYLITTIILSEKEKGIFSLVKFYERRARRIIPALFFVMLFSTIFSWAWLPPSHMEDFSQSLVAVSVFSSNILFWKESGYWGVENELKPLLHTWSLAVEEQFYLLFPIFLMLMWRFRKRWLLGAFLIIAIGSLSLSHWAAFNNPTANFFLLTTRGWELGIGVGVAFYFLYRKQVVSSFSRYSVVGELLSLLGLVLIGYAVIGFDENTPFPSLYALVPTIGAALIIIFSTKNTLVGKVLGSRLPLSIGLISYSAYLWHQPLFAFARHRSLQELTPMLLFVLSLASLLLAYISWKYVEAPFRKHGNYSRKQIFLFTAIGSIFFISFGIIGHYTNGYKFRLDDMLAELVKTSENEGSFATLCERYKKSLFHDKDYCVLVPNDSKYAFLYGDSHAQSLMSEAKKAFEKTDIGLLYASANACPPVKDVYRADSPIQRACYEQNNEVYDYIMGNPEIEFVILAARWTLGMEGSRFDNQEGGVERGRKPQLDIVENGKYLTHRNYSHRPLIAKAYVKSIHSLLASGKKVIVVYPIPEAGWNVPDYLSQIYWLDQDLAFNESTASTSYDVFKTRNKRAIDALDEIQSNEKLFRIHPEKIFCDNAIIGRCITHKEGVIFYRDDDHVSDEGAKKILEMIVDSL